MTTVDADGNIISDHVLATDPNTMTVKEMKKHLLGKPVDCEE